MKKVEAIIKPFKIDEVREALVAAGVSGMTVTDVRGCGSQPEKTHCYEEAEYTIDLLPRTKVEVVVADDRAETVVAVICKAAWTGSVGDGKVFVLPILEALRIRTGEMGGAAL